MRDLLLTPVLSWGDMIVVGATLIPAIHGDWTIAALAYFVGFFALGWLKGSTKREGGSDA